MPQTFDINKEILATQPLKPILSMSGTRPESILDASSTCSCPQCNSIDCFMIRYDNANLQCTCPSCKYASHKNVQSEKANEESYRDLDKKVNDDDKSSINTNTISQLPNEKSDDQFNGKPSKDVVEEDEVTNALDTNTKKDMAYKKSDALLNSTVLEENNVKDSLINNIKTDLLHQKFDDNNDEKDKNVLKENKHNFTLKSNIKSDLAIKKTDEKSMEDEREDISKSHVKYDLANKEPGEECYREITIKEHEQKDALKVEKLSIITVKQYKQNDTSSSNMNNNKSNRKSVENSHFIVTRKGVEERKQKDSLNHEIDRKNIKEAEKIYTHNSKIKSDLINSKKSADQFCSDNRKSDLSEDDENCKKCGKRHKHKDPLRTSIIQSKSYFSNKNEKIFCDETKSDNKRHEQKAKLKTYCKEDLPHKNYDYIRHCKITKKVVSEYIQTDTVNKLIKNEHSEVDLQKKFIKDKVKTTETSYEESYTRNYSVAMTCSRKKENTELENPTATLSAQIMDLPYQDFKDSVSLHKSAGIVNSNKITKQDILAKLKEIYQACSCKVCECIPSFVGNYVSKDDTCGCKDIEQTNTCHAQLDSQTPQRDCQQLPHSGCPCYRCDRKDCRGVWKNEMSAAINSCDCKPCDCVRFTQSFTKPCDCEPCQCVECRPLNKHLSRPVIVAPVQGNFQQSRCQCEPCECANCTQNHGEMASSLMREVSTGMVSQRNCNCNSCVSNACQFDGVDCKCDTQNRIVRKPIDRSGRDYDLRQAIVGENSFNRKSSGKFKNCDAIAMFTFADKPYSNAVFNKSRQHKKHSECSFCKEKEKHGIRIKNSHEGEDSPLIFSDLCDKSLSISKCRWCCKDREAENDIIKTKRALSDCSCTTCNCMACKGLLYYSQNNVFADHSKSRCKEIVHRSIKNGEHSSDKIAAEFPCPSKKGKLLTPAMFEAKIGSPTKPQMQLSLSDVTKLSPSSVLQLSGKCSSLCTENITITHSNLVTRNFNNDHNQSRYKKLRSRYPNESNIDTDSNMLSRHDDNSSAYLDTNKQNNIKNNSLLPTNIILQRKSTASVDNIITKVNHNKAEDELCNSQVLNVRCQLKVRKNSDAYLFFSRIETIEFFLSQLQEDISLNRTYLANIWCKDSKISRKSDFDDNILTIEKSYENHIPDAEKYLDTNEETINLQKPESATQAIVNHQENSQYGITKSVIGNNIKFDQNDNFSKGDTKMYSKLVKKSQNNVTKSRKNITRSKFKKISKKIESKIIIDFIVKHLKKKYWHHGNNNLNLKCTKSVSTSYENCLQLKFEDNRTQPKEIYESNAKLWSALQKNLYINDATDTHNDNNKSHWCIPELEINTKRTAQSISMQTIETRGHAALEKLQTEVSKLLNSPLLQLGYTQRYVTSDMDEEITSNMRNTNYYCRPKTKLDLELKHIRCDASSQTSKLTHSAEKEINCNIGQSLENMKIDMTKLLDFLLTRTVCKSELTKPFTTLPEMFTTPKVNYVKSSCEGLKASFLTVRKVSDHTVLVRWKVPRDVENVQGYELQVDGRTVQKILSPMRCMAVLTCLPHCDRLLLTIQTLTLSVLPSGHRPAATIVYYPRERRSRHH